VGFSGYFPEFLNLDWSTTWRVPSAILDSSMTVAVTSSLAAP